MPAAAPITPAPTVNRPCGNDLYRRQARRLRGALRGQPGRLQQKLRELADRHDSMGAPAEGYDSPPAPAHDRRARAFADEVAARMDGPVLRYSQRRILMSIARRAGVGHFEANLIIAAVRHRQVAGGAAPVLAQAASPRPSVPLAPLLVVIGVEALVVLGTWRVFFQ